MAASYCLAEKILTFWLTKLAPLVFVVMAKTCCYSLGVWSNWYCCCFCTYCFSYSIYCFSYCIYCFSWSILSKVESLWKGDFYRLWGDPGVRRLSGCLSGPIATANEPPQTAFEIYFLFNVKIGCGYSLVFISLRPSSPLEFWPQVHKRPSLSLAMPNEPPMLTSAMSASTTILGSKKVPNTPVPQK